MRSRWLRLRVLLYMPVHRVRYLRVDLLHVYTMNPHNPIFISVCIIGFVSMIGNLNIAWAFYQGYKLGKKQAHAEERYRMERLTDRTHQSN